MIIPCGYLAKELFNLKYWKKASKKIKLGRPRELFINSKTIRAEGWVHEASSEQNEVTTMSAMLRSVLVFGCVLESAHQLRHLLLLRNSFLPSRRRTRRTGDKCLRLNQLHQVLSAQLLQQLWPHLWYVYTTDHIIWLLIVSEKSFKS